MFEIAHLLLVWNKCDQSFQNQISKDKVPSRCKTGHRIPRQTGKIHLPSLDTVTFVCASSPVSVPTVRRPPSLWCGGCVQWGLPELRGEMWWWHRLAVLSVLPLSAEHYVTILHLIAGFFCFCKSKMVQYIPMLCLVMKQSLDFYIFICFFQRMKCQSYRRQSAPSLVITKALTRSKTLSRYWTPTDRKHWIHLMDNPPWTRLIRGSDIY